MAIGMMRKDGDKIESLIETINTEGEDLTEWELGFMENVTDHWERGGGLSKDQRSKVYQIYHERVHA